MRLGQLWVVNAMYPDPCVLDVCSLEVWNCRSRTVSRLLSLVDQVMDRSINIEVFGIKSFMIGHFIIGDRIRFSIVDQAPSGTGAGNAGVRSIINVCLFNEQSKVLIVTNVIRFACSFHSRQVSSKNLVEIGDSNHGLRQVTNLHALGEWFTRLFIPLPK